ncbi:PD-(D/E)XK nuclease family protein (plasmid) [Natrinema zhouii]|uniref:PD-(D/E)XK nuclease family protein n=1 Tax=Natrinema zhouii TaxID=1710539 RepID=UPI001CFF58F0|nr:PD-(D/E)XK nuclease family protein [Natrinema zhouii]UHQ98152.1 PD-(D/E)XK nuclease family protein [Natrinema zhouii]
MSQGLSELISIEEENDLTRTIIGVLELLGPDALNEIFTVCHFEEHPEVRYDQEIQKGSRRRIDAILEDGNQVLAIESKLGATYNSSQLEDEFQDLTEYADKSHHLYLITGHTTTPAGLNSLNIPEDNLSWIGWEKIAEILAEFSKTGISSTQNAIAEFATNKLHTEGFKPFDGFHSVLNQEKTLTKELNEANQVLAGYLEQVNTFRRKLDGLLADDGLQSRELYRDGTSSSLNRFPKKWGYVPRHIWIVYADQSSEVGGRSGSYLSVNFDSKDHKIISGYQMSISRDEKLYNRVQDNRKEIKKQASEYGANLYQLSYYGYLGDAVTDQDQIESRLEDDEWLKEERWVVIGFDHTLGETVDTSTVEEVASKLLKTQEIKLSL